MRHRDSFSITRGADGRCVSFFNYLAVFPNKLEVLAAKTYKILKKWTDCYYFGAKINVTSL